MRGDVHHQRPELLAQVELAAVAEPVHQPAGLGRHHAVINPLLAEGQRHGGIAQGAAQAFLEEVIYDLDGNPLTASFADYPFLSAAEVPSFELAGMATPTSYNPLGVKGIGEAGTIGATPAVRTRSSTRWRISACGISTCPPPRNGSGGPSGKPRPGRTRSGAALAAAAARAPAGHGVPHAMAVPGTSRNAPASY